MVFIFFEGKHWNLMELWSRNVHFCVHLRERSNFRDGYETGYVSSVTKLRRKSIGGWSRHARLARPFHATHTSSILSPFLMPACSAAPRSRTALTCCRGAYSSPLMLRSWPPSLTWPRTLKPKPVSVLLMVTMRGPPTLTLISDTRVLLRAPSAILAHLTADDRVRREDRRSVLTSRRDRPRDFLTWFALTYHQLVSISRYRLTRPS